MKDIRNFQRVVLKYWREHGRHDLPWRNTRDPYAILVSEIMLQQTQVDRVVPYFDRWLKRFPSVKSLAQARLSDVLKEWQGLGYNRRAKLLRECAKEVVEKYSGKIPKDFAALVALPAIGPYTAGAIRAFAFDESEVFVETNIRAALIHHFSPRSRKVPDSKILPILQALLCKRGLHNKHTRYSASQIGPRIWYSALMDYGAYVKKTNPNPSRRSKHHTKQSRFQGSLRQMRGDILRALVASPSLRMRLLSRCHLDSRFEEAINSLEKEDLIEKDGNTWRLAR